VRPVGSPPKTSPTSAEQLAECALCGAPFVCGAQSGAPDCWCRELASLVPVPGRGCLCRDCLEQELRAAHPPAT
jgi:hypothetical protein